MGFEPGTFELLTYLSIYIDYFYTPKFYFCVSTVNRE